MAFCGVFGKAIVLEDDEKERQMPNDRTTSNLWNVTATGAVFPT